MTLQQVFPQADHSPFIVEQIAIDATNALSGAAIGLRGFRSRPLLRRLWDGVTGQGKELQAAIGSDLVTVQQATLKLVREVMAEEVRTQYCVERVLHNLRDINVEVDELFERVTMLEKQVEVLQKRQQLLEKRQRLLEIKMQLESLFREGGLHSGTGAVFGSALYLAQITRLYAPMSELAEEDEQRVALLTQREERRVALAVIRGQIGDTPDAIPLLFAQAIEQMEPEALESISFLASNDHGPMLRVFDQLVERQRAGLQTDIRVIEEAITTVRKLRDPDGLLRGNVMRPQVFVEHIADELLNSVSIMIGEIRDIETAKKSVEAALTGHLVLVEGYDDE